MGGRVALLIAGLCCLLSAYRLAIVPLAPDAPEMNSWLFRQFGQQGVAIGSTVAGVVMVGLALILMARVLRQRAIKNS